MRKIVKHTLSMMNSVLDEIERTEKNKASSEKRMQLFLQERESSSESHKRIKAIRDSIQHKSQSDQ